ncbi:MAG: ABC transporter ATP-binding protein, partial [Chloroflexi bacterium]|nr:ABC transporter ATP-binding protein [Chloroflexota bacterium]
MALVLALAAEEVGAGRATGGTLVAFFTLTGLLSPIFQRVADANRYLQEAEISVDRLAAFLELQPESPADETRPALRVRGGVVSVEGVSFSYADGTAALDNVSLQARRGELIALVGPNGAGKSTLLDLLLRFQQPTSGRITIDGQDIAEVSLTSLRSQIGLVSQDAPIFEATVRENVAYGVRGDVAEDRLERVARLTGVDRLVAELPEGWETKLGDRRRVLSRGERQRVAVARGLVSDPPIVVLDEATASLDAATEQALARVLRELARHKTVIVAAHRLPLVLAADRVYVLEDGRVVEEGTPASLAGWGGVYGRLFGASAATPGPTPRESDGRERPPGRDGGIGDDGSFSLAPCRPPHRGR